MNYITGISDKYPHERFITFTEASEILGSGNHSRVRKLVLSGDLPAYQIPCVSKFRVRKSDLLRLLSVQVGKKELSPYFS